MNLASSLEKHAAQSPARPAILFEGRTLSYAELDASASNAQCAISPCPAANAGTAPRIDSTRIALTKRQVGASLLPMGTRGIARKRTPTWSKG